MMEKKHMGKKHMGKKHMEKKYAGPVVTGTFIGLLMLTALLAPVLSPNDPNATDLAAALSGPSAQYPLGTDALGRCMLSRVLYGARVSVFTSLIIILIVFMAGTIIGVLAGYMGGLTDRILTKIITMMQAFPKFILAIAIAGILGFGIGNMILALCLVEWAQYARVARSLCKTQRQRTYIQAARMCGASHIKIMMIHIIPNIMPALIVNASLGISSMIMEVAALSYLGIGVASPMAEWGAMMNGGKNYIQTQTGLVLIPGAAIFITSALFNLFGDQLRDIFAKKGV